ncbi:MAG: TonB-dependent receptor [Arenimonas sp.]
MSLSKRLNRPLTPTLLACALASCLMVVAPSVLAQSTAATLRGQAASGGSVTATNTATGYSRTVQAGSNGDYVLTGLPPGTYKVDGGGGSRTIVLQVGQVAYVNLAAGAPATIAGVVVVGNSLPETKTSEVATYVTPKQIEALPQGSRNFLAFADTVPGMVFTNDGTNSSLRGGGQSANGINVFIDGVGQKNYVLKGGISAQDSSRGNPFPQLGIAEYKVITSNYKAEFDQLSSAAVVAVTKSGTNKFHGDVFYDYSDQGMREKTPREIDAGQEIDSKDVQYGVSFGGPIVKDQAHYFFAYEHKDIDTPKSVSPGFGLAIEDLPSQFQSLANATTGSPFQEDLYFAKVDWKLSDEHLFELSAKYRTEDELINVGGVNTADYGTLKSNDETRVDLRWQWSQDNWLNDAHLTYEDASWSPRPATIGNGYVLTGPNRQTILNTGGGRDYQDKGQQGWALQDDFTFYGWDKHTVKAGFKYKKVDVSAFEQQPYNPQFLYDITESLTTPYVVQFGANNGGLDRKIDSNNSQFGIYIQDDWEATDKLLVNFGVRWDYEKSPGYLDYQTPAALAAALRGWANVHGPNSDYNVEDYISDGSNRDAFTGAWQPRVGFSYDFSGDQRHVLFGGAGRSYDRNLWDYLALEQSKSTFPTYEFQFNTPGHPCTPGVGTCLAFNPAYYDPDNLAALVAANPFLGTEVNAISNDLKTPYSDQFSLGMRNSFEMFTVDWNSSVTLMHVVSHDGIVFSLGNRFPDGSFRDPNCVGATWGCQPWGFPIPGYGTFIKADNGIETKLDSLLVSLEKPYSEASGWGMTLAYTYSDAKENRNNAYNSDEHYLFDYPTPDAEGFHRTLGLSKHRLVMTGVLDGWYGSVWSGKLTLASPTPKESLNCHDIGFSNCFWDPFTPNTAIGYKQFDLAAEKRWSLGNDMSIRLRMDVLNVFNWYNWTDYDTWHGGPGAAGANPTFGQRNGLGITYPTRMFKLTGGFTW